MWSIIRSHHITVLLHKECECTAGMIKAALTKVLAKRKKAGLLPPEISSSCDSTYSHVILAQNIACPLPWVSIHQMRSIETGQCEKFPKLRVKR